MPTEALHQCTYIVRVWKEATTHPGEQPWRFVLLTTDATRRQGFGEIEQLCKTLQNELLKIIQETPT